MHFGSTSRKLVLNVFDHFVDFPRAALGGGLFSRITTLSGTAVQAAHFYLLFFVFVLVFMWGSALLTPCECVKLDQKSK